MVMINRATKEITFKVVYYGPGLCGKTTNLENIYASTSPDRKGKLLTVATETDRTLFFDLLPMELGTVRGMKIRVQLYTVPGQVFYDATRRIVLRSSDGVVFVADSQRAMMDANAESMENLKTNLKLNGLDSETIPLVLQFNKQDLPELCSEEELEALLNWRKAPHFLSVATQGTGVRETLKKIMEVVIRKAQALDMGAAASEEFRVPGPALQEEPAAERSGALASPPPAPAPSGKEVVLDDASEAARHEGYDEAMEPVEIERMEDIAPLKFSQRPGPQVPAGEDMCAAPAETPADAAPRVAPMPVSPSPSAMAKLGGPDLAELLAGLKAELDNLQRGLDGLSFGLKVLRERIEDAEKDLL